MKSLKKNFFFNILLNLSRVVFPLITAPYIARVLEPDNIGLFNFANTYASYFALFAALGLPTYGIRETAKVRNDKNELSKFVSEILSLTSITTIFYSIIFLCTLFFIPQLNINFLVFLISGIILYTAPLKIDWFFVGHEDFSYVTYRSLIIKTVSIIALFVFVHEKKDFLLYVILNVISSIANDIWNFIKLRQFGLQIRFTLDFKKHVKPMLILFSSAAAVSIYTALDTIMLGFLAEYREVAFYNSATHISKNLLAVSTSLSEVAIPRLSLYLKNDNWNDINLLIKKSFSIISFLSFPMTVGLMILAPVFVPLFFGKLYYGAIVPLQIMACIIIAIGFNNWSGRQILVGLGFDKLILYAVLGGALTNFVLNILLIPKYGASGAAIASVFAETIVFLISLYFTIYKTKVSLNGIFRDFILCISGVCLLFPLSYFLAKFFENWAYIFAFTFSSIIVYCTFQYLLKNSSALLIKDVLKKKFIH
jgi:O-antigen/teichoic acid export membrane protein